MTGNMWLDWLLALGLPSVLGVVVASVFDLRRDSLRLTTEREIEEMRQQFEEKQQLERRKHESSSLRLQERLNYESNIIQAQLRREETWIDLYHSSLKLTIQKARQLADVAMRLARLRVELATQDWTTVEQDKLSRNLFDEGLEVARELEFAIIILGTEPIAKVAADVLNKGRSMIEISDRSEDVGKLTEDFRLSLEEFSAEAAKAIENARIDTSIARQTMAYDLWFREQDKS